MSTGESGGGGCATAEYISRCLVGLGMGKGSTLRSGKEQRERRFEGGGVLGLG